ncbi:DUF2512 family protein [Exiguobacterium sp. s6]|uniref:DUF2512 family protein n=1 Tax=Exiguobacterium sp. s6 TaxID=2751236 RepID=UPI001BEB5522|nr:DUF2512 family protein [Exiguobacterium sp. s6]
MEVNHLKALTVKHVALLVVFLAVLTFGFNVPWYHAVWISFMVAIIAYWLGDLFVLRKFGNLIATAADFGLVFFLTWFFLWILDFDIGTDTSFVLLALYTALVTAVVEFVFHGWLLKHKREEAHIHSTR